MELCVGRPDRLHESVVRQLVPLCPTSSVGADEVGVFEFGEGLVALSAGAVACLSAEPVVRDQFLLEPVPDHALLDMRATGYCGYF